MSHEIRTPLNGIIGAGNLLLDTDLDEEQTRFAEMLKSSAELLLEIVNDILDFSKNEAGKLELETIDFDLRQIIEQKLGFFTILARKKNLSLDYSIEENVPTKLRGDANQLRQVLNNLISNAIKFTEKGKISIRVSLKEKTDMQVTLCFTVSDTGLGIADKQKAKLFQPFVQADVSTTRRFGGTGLGLAICKQIVERMSGEIGVESEFGKGSTFWFTVCFQFQSPFDTQSLKTPLAEGQRSKIKARSLKILIAEDNPVNREITLAMLKQLGVEAETAGNGLAAVKKSVSKNYDVILMDCQMPEMDGFQAARTIRQQENDKNRAKIIALTASGTAEDRDRCLAVGMDDFLCKPLTKHELSNMLNNYFPASFQTENIDSGENFVQHSFAHIITPEKLAEFSAIESRGEKNFTLEMLELFCGHSEKQLSEIKSAFVEKNAGIIREKAHNLKGSSANVGVAKLFELFEELENTAQTENWAETEKCLTEISKEFETVKQIVLRGKYES